MALWFNEAPTRYRGPRQDSSRFQDLGASGGDVTRTFPIHRPRLSGSSGNGYSRDGWFNNESRDENWSAVFPGTVTVVCLGVFAVRSHSGRLEEALSLVAIGQSLRTVNGVRRQTAWSRTVGGPIQHLSSGFCSHLPNSSSVRRCVQECLPSLPTINLHGE